MLSYIQELRRCQVVLLLRAVIEARGNMCAAALSCGVHRNTITRILRRAGYNSMRLKALDRERGVYLQPKPASSVSVESAQIGRLA